MFRIARSLVDRIFERTLRGETPVRAFDHLYQLPPADLAARAEAGDGKAAYVLGDKYDQGDDIPMDRAEAVRWYRVAEDLGDGDAMNKLGSMHQHDEGLPHDLYAARDYYERGAVAGCGVALGNLGLLHKKGLAGVAVDARRAFQLFRRGAQAGDDQSMISLGSAYLRGAGTRQKPLRALWWYRQAARRGGAGGLYNLGQQYRTGEFVRRDLAKAEQFYEEAVLHRHAAAAMRLGEMREHGTAAPADLHEALRYYALADRYGDEDASVAVSRLRAALSGTAVDEEENAAIASIGAAMRDAMPPGLPLPPAFAELFAWMDANRCVRSYTPG